MRFDRRMPIPLVMEEEGKEMPPSLRFLRSATNTPIYGTCESYVTNATCVPHTERQS